MKGRSLGRAWVPTQGPQVEQGMPGSIQPRLVEPSGVGRDGTATGLPKLAIAQRRKLGSRRRTFRTQSFPGVVREG